MSIRETKKSKIVFAALFLLITLLLPPQAQSKQAMQNITETILPNGLKVLIEENHQSPVFAQSIFYDVGSRLDPKGRSGIAHYLEHMQFNGTDKLSKTEISSEIERLGGSFNAATSTDYTVYYVTMPSSSEGLEFSLRLEADRMRNSKLDAEEAAREKKVVMTELAGGENNPFTVIHRQTMKALYPEHPYGIPIIGWPNEIEATTPADLKAFYDNFYQPDNATLVLSGDLDTAKTMELVKKYFGGLPKPSRVLNKSTVQLKNNSDKQTESRKVQVKIPSESNLLIYAWDTVNFAHPDYVSLSVVASVLAGGKLSRLEKALVETGLASYVGANLRQGKEDFAFSIIVATDRQGDLQKIGSVIERELAKLIAEGASPEELARVKAKAETGFIFGLEEPSGMASQLGSFEVVGGDWRRTYGWLEELKQMPLAAVQTAAKKYLDPNRAVIGELNGEPGGAELLDPSAAGGVQHYKPVTDTPRAAQSVSYKVDFSDQKLANGLRLIHRENAQLPIIAISATVDAGEGMAEAGSELIPTLAAMMLERGTKTRSKDQLNIELENIGAELSVESSEDFLHFTMKGRAEDFEALVDILADVISSPSFPEEELKTLKVQLLSEIEQGKDEPGSLARTALYKSILDKDHPYRALSPDEEIARVQQITTADLSQFHTDFINQPASMIVSLSGAVSASEAERVFSAKIKKSDKAGKAKDPFKQDRSALISKKATTVQAELPGKSQAIVMLGQYVPVDRSSDEYYAMLLANEVLGGGSTLASLLGKEVREENGLVYSIYSSLHSSRAAGPFTIKMGIATENIPKAVALSKQCLKELIAGEFSGADLERAKSHRIGAFISRILTTNAAVASSLNYYAIWGLPLETINEYPELISAVDKQQVTAVSKKHLNPEALSMSVYKPASKK